MAFINRFFSFLKCCCPDWGFAYPSANIHILYLCSCL